MVISVADSEGNKNEHQHKCLAWSIARTRKASTVVHRCRDLWIQPQVATKAEKKPSGVLRRMQMQHREKCKSIAEVMIPMTESQN